MKKNKEQILKYLAGMLSEEEKREFEKRLEISLELKNEYEEIVKSLQRLSEIKEIELDERYFTSLLPRIFERIRTDEERLSEKKKLSLIRKLSYSLPILIIAAIILFLMPKSSTKFEDQLKTITQEMISNFDDSVELKYLANYPVELAVSNELKVDNEIDASFIQNIELPSEYIKKYEPNLFDEYIDLSNFSEQELATLYNDLSELKIK